MPSKGEELLILEDSVMSEKVLKLFDQMKNDKRLAMAFVRNPINVLVNKVLPSKYTEALDRKSINAANDLLFSVLSNENFSKWLREYQEELVSEYNETGEIREKNDIRKDLSKALLKYGDEEILINIINAQESIMDIDIRGRDVPFVVLDGNPVAIYKVTTAVDVAVDICGIDIDKLIDIKNQISPSKLRTLSNQIIKNAKIRKEKTAKE